MKFKDLTAVTNCRIVQWLVLLTFIIIPLAANAQFIFTTNNGAITIVGYNGTNNNVVIPGLTNGFPVVSIGNAAFLNNFHIVNVTIPDSITNIGNSAFESCTSLTNISMGTNILNIGSSAFETCSELAGVVIPNGVISVGDHAFYQCSSLANVAIPDSLTSIGSVAFNVCSALTSIKLSTNLTSIGEAAFAECTSLTSMAIPDSVTSLGQMVLDNCHSLTNLTIGRGVTNIIIPLFSACTALTAVSVDTNNSTYCSLDGVLFNRSQTLLMEYPGGKAGRYTIPNSVADILFEAFEDCPHLSSVTIPNSVSNIASYAFVNCQNLTNVYFTGDPHVPANDSSVFAGDSNATVYYLPGTIGWGTLFDGRPTVLWNPQAQTSGAGFGVQNGQFGFNITGASNLVLEVDACTNLADPAWIPLSTNTLTGGSSYFCDSQWTNYPTRFYRLGSQ